MKDLRRGSVLAAALLAACALHGARSSNPADDAQQRLAETERAAQRDPSLRARAGWLRYLIASDSASAGKLLSEAANTGAGSERALALCGLGELAEDRADSIGAVKDWIAAIQTAPTDPLAELAAARLLDAEGESPEIDAAIAAAAAQAKAPMSPRAARLLREAAARGAGREAQVKADPRIEVDAWRAVGGVQQWRVAGPFAALRVFSLRQALVLDGPSPAIATAFDRALFFPDADVGLDMEPGDGDVFYAASDVTLAQGGDYLLWVEGAAAMETRLDGAVVVSRVPYPRESSRAQTAPVRLDKGVHHLLVRWSRAEGARFRVTLARGDGGPSDLLSAAPAEVSGSRASAPCALGEACTAAPAWRDRADLRVAASALLERDPGDALASWLLARATLGDDRIASRTAVDRTVVLTGSGAPALALRAQQLLRDPEIPERISRARALSDLIEASRKDPVMLRARLTAAAIERDSERFDDAAQDLDKAEALLTDARQPLPSRLLSARARLLDARGNTAGARSRAEAALKAGPGRCDTLQLLLDLARRDGSLADQRRYTDALTPCADGLTTQALFARGRGELARAEELLRLAVSLRPAQPSRLEQLSEVQAALDEIPLAVASVRAAAALTSRSPEPERRLAGLLELLGEKKGAQEARKAALRLAPGDLQLRQQLALDEGVRLLSWTDRDAVALAKAPPQADVPAGSSAVRLLDYGAVQFFPDGGGAERVHTVARVLDKKGVGKFGEAQIPPDAMVLHLRTLKADGRVLEPESIPEKEGISMPGLEPGDAVEIDYLHGIGPRGPDMPGVSPGSFFFRDDETPLAETTYEVLSATPLEVDVHNLTLPRDALVQEGDATRFHYTARNVPPLLPQPHAPGEAEIMPWVQLGKGAGQREMVLAMADWAMMRTRPGSATDELARMAAGKSPRETAEQIYAAVAQAVRGRSQSTELGQSASHVLAQGRGNRLVVEKAALTSAGIRSHLVLARTFGSDPAPYRFPRGELYPYAVLRIDLPEGPVYVDPSYRLAPFGQLPAFIRGQEAWVVPEPGEEPAQIRLPATLPGERDGRAVSFDLTLDPSGSAAGQGHDDHFGFEAASLKDVLERLDKDQRKQAVEAMLGHGLRGVTLDSLSTAHEADLGGTATLQYGLHVELARRDGDRLFVPSSLLPSRLVRRWGGAAERSVLLLVDAPETATSRTTVLLPKGKHLRNPPAPVSLSTPFGDYRWSAREEDGKLVLEESERVPQQRVAPEKYAAFMAFAAGVDEAQSQELLIAP